MALDDEGVSCKWSINLTYALPNLSQSSHSHSSVQRVRNDLIWHNTVRIKPTIFCWVLVLGYTRIGRKRDLSLPPSQDVPLLMAALACGYDPHWPFRHKMCESNQGLVSYIRAAVIGSQRSLVPLNYSLTQPSLHPIWGCPTPAPLNWCVPPGAFKPHKASCSWSVSLH